MSVPAPALVPYHHLDAIRGVSNDMQTLKGLDPAHRQGHFQLQSYDKELVYHGKELLKSPYVNSLRDGIFPWPQAANAQVRPRKCARNQGRGVPGPKMKVRIEEFSQQSRPNSKAGVKPGISSREDPEETTWVGPVHSSPLLLHCGCCPGSPAHGTGLPSSPCQHSQLLPCPSAFEFC